MPKTVKSAIATGDPIRAYGPNNMVIAESRDYGKTWTPTKEGLALEERRRSPVPRVFERRIAAVVDAATPGLERRVMTPFSILHETGTLAGWAPYTEIADLDDKTLDGIVVPGVSATPERMNELRHVGHKVLLDLDLMTSLEGDEGEALKALLPFADAVTVPTDLFASRLRSLHSHVFVVPDLLRADLWSGRRRQIAPKRPFVKIGLPTTCSETIEIAVQKIAEKYGDRVVFERIDWWTVFPAQEPDRYLDLDIVIVPAPKERHMVGTAPLLPAMAAGCAVIADRLWPLVRSGSTGYHIGRDSVVNWAGTMNIAIMDSRNRITMGRLAASQARRWTPELRVNQIFLPMRLVIPKSAPVTYA